ncbi:ras guanine nucleotide exchange factor domain-containing protein [Chytriomyces sp. MP71]|nr:ras guanine nucleotide exchange factor domain-containing protein [Chytriomyces sp. MP71]
MLQSAQRVAVAGVCERLQGQQAHASDPQTVARLVSLEGCRARLPLRKDERLVVTRVLMGKKPSARAKMLEKFIDVALNLRRRNNFNTLQSLISGLTSTPLSRLKQTQALLNPESAASFANLEILMSSERTFARYRHALAIADFPCIPYLGVVFRDLIYIEEGNKDLLPDGNVNFGKLLTMGDIILTVQGFQAKPHSVPKDPGVLSFILDSTVLSNEVRHNAMLGV